MIERARRRRTISSGFSWHDLVPYRVRLEGVNVISLAGLLRMKENGRLKDRADAGEIRKVLDLPSSPAGP